MADKSQPALVLDREVAQSEPVHFAGFPGLWRPDQPIAVSELGLGDADETYRRVDQLGLPLARTTVPAGEGLMPDVPNHVRAGEVPVAIEDGDVETVEAPAPLDPFAEAVSPKADDLIAAIPTLDDADQLAGMLAAEKAGKSRTTVIAALEERLAAVTPDEEEVTG